MLKNTNQRYGLISKTLHWALAVLIISLIWLGWYMVGLSYYDRWYNATLSLHKSFGLLALALAIINVGWHLYSRPPADVATLKLWERIGAEVTHFMLYVLMLAIPLSGYLVSTSAGQSIAFFSWVDIPALYPIDDRLRDFAIEVHYYMAYGAVALVIVHILGALKHHFIDRDATLLRIINK